MSISYFRQRDRYDFSSDTLDIGNAITWKRAHFLKHLFKRIFAIGGSRMEEFYQRHYHHYAENFPDGNEEVFFKYLWELVEGQLNVLKGKDVYDENHIRNQRQIEQFQKLTTVLISHDRWNLHRSNDGAVARQQAEIFDLTQQSRVPVSTLLW